MNHRHYSQVLEAIQASPLFAARILDEEFREGLSYLLMMDEITPSMLARLLQENAFVTQICNPLFVERLGYWISVMESDDTEYSSDDA